MQNGGLGGNKKAILKTSRECHDSEAMDVDTPNSANSKEDAICSSNNQSTKSDNDSSHSQNSATLSKELSKSDRQMKKDDSGISIEKSPEEESFSSDEGAATAGENYERANKAKMDFKKLEIKSEENGNTLNSPDSGNQDCSYSLPEIDNSSGVETLLEAAAEINKVQNQNEEAKNSDKKPTLSVDDTVKHFGEGDTEKSDDASEKSDDTCQMNSSDDDKKFDPTPKTPRPKHKWFLCQEVIDRQYGASSKFAQDLFRLRCYGSLHMVERLELMYKMKKHEGCVNTLHFNSNGTRLASGSDDLDIVVWDWAISEPVLEYPSGHRSNVFQAKFMPLSGDCHIVSCARDGQIRIAELSSTGVCKSTRRLAQHRGAAHKLAVQVDSPHTFLSCGEDAVVFEIDLREGKPEKLVTCKESDKKVPLYTIFINPFKTHEYAIGGRDHYVRIYDKRCTRDDSPMKKLCPQHLVDSDIRANVTCLVYNYNGSQILASYNDEDIYAFDNYNTSETEYLHRYCGHRNNQTVKGVNYFGPKSEYVVSGSDCGFIYLWDSTTEHIVQFMHGDEGGVVNCLEPHPSCPVLATSGLDDDIKIWVPSCEESPDLALLTKQITLNMKERDDERKRDGVETFDGQMLWYLMQHLHRARRRAEAEGQDIEESSSSDSDSDNHEDDGEMQQAIQCTQS